MMQNLLALVIAMIVPCTCAFAQDLVAHEPLLDHMVGKWVLRGVIAHKQTTHDVVAEWVLNNEYIEIHEVSREKDAQDKPAYEAIVLIGLDPPKREYTCLWLDSTTGSGLASGVIARAKQGGDSATFLFKSNGVVDFRTTFAYSKDTDTWQWIMDNVKGMKQHPFARLKLTRE